MSFFIDCHPLYQPDLRFPRVKTLGYFAAVVKASEGTTYVPKDLGAYVDRVEEAGLTLGLYHFLDDTNGDKQAAHFVDVVRSLGGPEGKLLVADFESYGRKTPTNGVLGDFVSGVKGRTDNHAVVCYSGIGFWTGGTPTGLAAAYGIDAAWDARYADMDEHDYPRIYWSTVKDWYSGQPRWGAMDPMAIQFTSRGKVDGTYMDVNKLLVEKDEFMTLTTRVD